MCAIIYFTKKIKNKNFKPGTNRKRQQLKNRVHRSFPEGIRRVISSLVRGTWLFIINRRECPHKTEVYWSGGCSQRKKKHTSTKIMSLVHTAYLLYIYPLFFSSTMWCVNHRMKLLFFGPSCEVVGEAKQERAESRNGSDKTLFRTTAVSQEIFSSRNLMRWRLLHLLQLQKRSGNSFQKVFFFSLLMVHSPSFKINLENYWILYTDLRSIFEKYVTHY